MIGKKIFSGKMDLTRISFPIKCMAPISTLELMPTLQSTMVVYLNKAASISDPLERMKLLMTHNISFFYKEKIFEKPLNPIVGETYQSVGQDGAMIYCEQSAHHPPTSHYLIEGPNKNYVFSGWLSFSIKSGMNSSNVDQMGYKQVKFKDGQTIRHNHHKDMFYNFLYGTISHQLLGSMEYHDEGNKLYGYYTFNKPKGKAQDYFLGEI